MSMSEAVFGVVESSSRECFLLLDNILALLKSSKQSPESRLFKRMTLYYSSVWRTIKQCSEGINTAAHVVEKQTIKRVSRVALSVWINVSGHRHIVLSSAQYSYLPVARCFTFYAPNMLIVHHKEGEKKTEN